MGFELDFLHSLEGLHSPVLDRIMLFITRLGDGSFIWFLISGILILLPPVKKILNQEYDDEYMNNVTRRRKVGFAILAAELLAMLIGNMILKSLVGRPRPFYVDPTLYVNTNEIAILRPSGSSFPSGHTSSSFAAAFTIFFFNKKAGIAAFLLASLIAFSRMYLFVHYPTDILGGIVVGFICAKLSSIFVEEIIR